MFSPARADTTTDPANPYAYGANIGWINAEANGSNGMVIGQAFCSGYLYAANVGWIHLGDGTPVDGMAYANNSSTDFGVNHDGLGHLTGYAYGANIGWINFEQTYGQPRVSLETGVLSGYAWGANIGWINLSTLATLTLDPGPDSDNDNLPDAWELGHTNTLVVLTNGGVDSDSDGTPDTEEYAGDTDPFDENDFLQITAMDATSGTNQVAWTSKPTRLYTLEYTEANTNGAPWTAAGPSFIGATPLSYQTDSGLESVKVYRVTAELPLSP